MTAKDQPGKIFRNHGLIHGAKAGGERSWSFDRRGLLRTAVAGTTKYKRGWSGKLQKIKLSKPTSSPRFGPPARLLAGEQKWQKLRELHRAGHQFLREHNEKKSPVGEWAREKYAATETEFKRIYNQVPILPPDQYRGLDLKLTTGCSYNNCSFCEFYAETPHRLKDRPQFSDHLQSVLDFFGPTLPYFNGIFLGAGDALTAPAKQIREALTVLEENPEVEDLPVACFGPGFVAREKSARQLRTIREAGLHRVYLGLESGSDRVLEKLDKPFDAQLFRRSVKLLKETGFKLGVILLLGAGGKEFSEVHTEHSGQLLNELPLDNEDLIFLSPLGENKIGWSRADTAEEIQPADTVEKWRQKERIQKLLDRDLSFCFYSVDKFIY